MHLPHIPTGYCSLEKSHANVPGLISYAKNFFFVCDRLKPNLRLPKGHVINSGHIAGLHSRESARARGVKDLVAEVPEA